MEVSRRELVVFFEPIVLYIRDDIAIANIGEKRYKKYMPFLLTVFFFIWFLNMFGLTPLGVNVTGNIAVTAALAVVTFLLTNLTGTKDYWKTPFRPIRRFNALVREDTFIYHINSD